ncbi:MAG: tetratricopeptide repeat protein [Spirochaetales bacterium]|nr:tetratricopeptide repeat protein [Spirochaetales bacterium]
MKNPADRKGESPSQPALLTFFKNNKNTILPILVFCLPVFLYLQTVSFGFIGFDDRDVITKNIVALSDFANIPNAFQKDAFLGKTSQFYRPMQTLSFMVDTQLSGGNNPWMYHLTSVVLLGLIALVLFLLLRKLLIPLKRAFISTLLFSAHPLFISSVSWIPGRGDWLLVLFSLLSFYFYIERLQSNKHVYLFLCWITFTIALYCKETAAILPIIFIIYYFTFSPKKRFEKKYILDVALFAVSGILWFWLRSTATRNLARQSNVGLSAFASNLQALPDSLARFFIPFDSSFISSFSIVYTLIGLGIMILIGAVFFLNKERTKKEKIFSLSWFVLLMLPAMIIKEDFIDYLSHRLFLPLIGIMLFVLFSIPKKWLEGKDRKRKIAVNGGFVCVFAFLSSVTVIHSRSFSDPMTFWNTSISQNPRNILMYTNRGYERYIRNDFQGAIEDFKKALTLDPDYAAAYNNMGTVYSAKGDLEQAVKEYDKAVQLDPRYAEAYNNRGKAYADMRDYKQAMKDFNKTIELNPNYAEAYKNRGNAYSDLGDRAMADKDYAKAIEVDPEFADAYINRGNLFSVKGDIDNAIANYRKAVELNPNYAEAYNNLGLAYQAKGALDSSLKDFDKAIEIKPNLPDFHYNRGNTYFYKGSFDNAVKDFEKAIELNPKYAEAYNNLGLAYQGKGDPDGALRAYDKAIQLKPGLAEAYYNRGNFYLMNRNFNRAIKEYDTAIELQPDYAQAYGIRGIAYSEKGDLNTAIKDYRKAIELNPGDANAYGNLGNAYKAKGMFKEADENFKMYQKLTGQNQ